jgi:DNA polymerase III epsilon subunit-like protein
MVGCLHLSEFFSIYYIIGSKIRSITMARDTLPDEKVYLDELARYNSEPQGSPNHSEDCSFEAFKSATDTIIKAISSKPKAAF